MPENGNLEVQRVKERLEEQFPLAVESFTQELEEANMPLEETVSVPPGPHQADGIPVHQNRKWH